MRRNSLIVAVVFAFCAASVSSAAPGAVYCVDDIADPPVGVPGDCAATCDGTNDCALRDAMAAAAASAAADQITFGAMAAVCDGGTPGNEIIVGAGGAFPVLTSGDTLIVPDAHEGCTVVVDGSSATADISIFSVIADDNVISGLVVQNFSDTSTAFSVSGSNATISNNYIGTSADGMSAAGNGTGVNVSGGTGTVIEENLISGNNTALSISGSAENVTVRNNRIGTDVTGDAEIPNNFVVIVGAGSDHLIQSNQISGNLFFAIDVVPNVGSNVQVLNNLIGVSSDGLSALNNGPGIQMRGGSNHLIQGNVISGHSGTGVQLVTESGQSAVNCTVIGNKIGWGIDGVTAIPNSGDSLRIDSPNHVIGGTTETDRNYILGGDGNSGIHLHTSAANGIVVQGNYIGINANREVFSADYSANSRGIAISAGAQDNIIGGDSPGAGNYIAGFASDLRVRDSASAGNEVIGNYFGIMPPAQSGLDPTACFVNTKHFGGVVFESSAAATLVRGNFFGGYQAPAAFQQAALNIAPDNLGAGSQSGHHIIGNHIGMVPFTTGDGVIGVAGSNCSVDHGIVAKSPASALIISENVIGNTMVNAIILEGDGHMLSGNLIGVNEAGTAQPNMSGEAEPSFSASNTCYRFSGNDYCSVDGMVNGSLFLVGECALGLQAADNVGGVIIDRVTGEQNFTLALIHVGVIDLRFTVLLDESMSGASNVPQCISDATEGDVPPSLITVEFSKTSWAQGQGADTDYVFPPVSTTNAVDGVTVSTLTTPSAVDPVPALTPVTVDASGSAIVLLGSSNNVITSTTIKNYLRAIDVRGGASDNVIGYARDASIDAEQVHKNIVSDNTTGVFVAGSTTLRNSIRGNEITANVEKGISLVDGGNASIPPPDDYRSDLRRSLRDMSAEFGGGCVSRRRFRCRCGWR